MLTPKQRAILTILAHHRDECPLSSTEINAKMGSWVWPSLDTLAKRGLVQRFGKTISGAWCWQITESGRAALSADPRGEG